MLLPGHAQVHVRVDEAREEVLALAVDDLAVVRSSSAPISAISPSRTRTSSVASSPVRGSSTWAPLIRTSAGGVGSVVEHGFQAGTGAVERAGCGAERPASSS